MSCKAELHIGDDHADNHATMRCQLEEGHSCRHQEQWRGGRCIVHWDGDDREDED